MDIYTYTAIKDPLPQQKKKERNFCLYFFLKNCKHFVWKDLMGVGSRCSRDPSLSGYQLIRRRKP
jgi:hypothetical protein